MKIELKTTEQGIGENGFWYYPLSPEDEPIRVSKCVNCNKEVGEEIEGWVSYIIRDGHAVPAYGYCKDHVEIIKPFLYSYYGLGV